MEGCIGSVHARPWDLVPSRTWHYDHSPGRGSSGGRRLVALSAKWVVEDILEQAMRSSCCRWHWWNSAHHTAFAWFHNFSPIPHDAHEAPHHFVSRYLSIILFPVVILPPIILSSIALFPRHFVVESDLGKLQDDEVPAKSLIAAKLEQIESGDLRAEDLREALCVEDTDVDLFSGIIEHGTGTLKIKPGKARPGTPEELRLRHHRIGLAWPIIGSKRKISPASLLRCWKLFVGFPTTVWANSKQLPTWLASACLS